MPEARQRRKPHQQTLTLATIGELAGGQAKAICDAALKAAVRDTEDRGADGKPRKVTIEITLKKVGRDGTGVTVEAKAKTTLPPYATDPTFGDLGMGDQGEIGHGTASIGKQLAGEVTGAGTIPEYVTFNFPVFANPCFRAIRASVECALEPDAGAGTFRVIPLPQQLEVAAESTLAKVAEEIREGLGDSGVSVYFGKP